MQAPQKSLKWHFFALQDPARCMYAVAVRNPQHNKEEMTQGPLQQFHESQTVATSMSKLCVVFCICSISGFAVRFLNAVHVLSNWWRCFLNLLVLHLFPCVYLSCCAFAPVGDHKSLARMLVLEMSLLQLIVCCPLPVRGNDELYSRLTSLKHLLACYSME